MSERAEESEGGRGRPRRESADGSEVGALPGPTSGLRTDLYQLTMACALWRLGRAERRSVYYHFFRRPPRGAAFAVACGLEEVADFVSGLEFARADLDWLAGIEGVDGGALFDEGFLRWLEELEPVCDVDAVATGEICFANTPLVRVEGPVGLCQILETPILNLVNFPTLVATRAARLCHLVVPDAAVLEFGYRRAQGPDGALTAARAAWIGGVAGTSNVAAGRCFDIPVVGTHPHSWVQCFESERRAFEAWVEAMPNNVTLLVDTYDTETGIERAIEVARAMGDTGAPAVQGLRLDSGDLAELSRYARRRLDEEGLGEVRIVASSDLDEARISELLEAGAQIDAWGIGTRLVTAWDDPALTGVYKLSAIERTPGRLDPTLKLSDDPAKRSLPGRLQVQRRERGGRLESDTVYDLDLGIDPEPSGVETRDLLTPLVRAGQRVRQPESARAGRQRVGRGLASLAPELRRLGDPVEGSPVRVEPRLRELADRLAERLLADAASEPRG